MLITRTEFMERLSAGDGEESVVFEDGGVAVTIKNGDADDDVLVVADLGVLPDDAASRGLLRDMMAANNAYAETCGGTLSVDPETMHVLLQAALWPGETGFDAAMGRVTAVVENAKSWRSRLEGEQAPPAEEPVDAAWIIRV